MEIKFAPSQIAKNNTMSYSSIHEKLENKKTIILDGGMGAELEKNGAKMDEKMLSLIHISEPTDISGSRMPSSA